MISRCDLPWFLFYITKMGSFNRCIEPHRQEAELIVEHLVCSTNIIDWNSPQYPRHLCTSRQFIFLSAEYHKMTELS